MLATPSSCFRSAGDQLASRSRISTAWGGAYAVSVDYLDDEAEPHLLWVAQSITSFAEAARVAIGHFEAHPLARDQAAAPGAEPGSP